MSEAVTDFFDEKPSRYALPNDVHSQDLLFTAPLTLTRSSAPASEGLQEKMIRVDAHGCHSLFCQRWSLHHLGPLPKEMQSIFDFL